MRLERLLGEPGADLADRLVLLPVGVVAREQERPVDVRPLALAVVAPDDDEVERVADAGEVVFLELWGKSLEDGRRLDTYTFRTLSQLTLRLLGS